MSHHGDQQFKETTREAELEKIPIWGIDRTEEEINQIADEMNQRTSLNYEELGEKLRRVANNMERLGNMARIIEKAQSNNPEGLPF